MRKLGGVTELYWYEVTEDFYNIDSLDSFIELRRGAYKESQNGDILGTGGLFLVSRVRADEYYSELGLKYVGYEIIYPDDV